MLVSAVLAFLVPFELFLFSYAFLGPLHYLTEITWLKKRDYFTNDKKDYVFLVIPCLVLSFISLIAAYRNTALGGAFYEFCTSVFGEHFLDFSTVMIYFAFMAALAFVIFKNTVTKIIFLLVTFFMGFVLLKVSTDTLNTDPGKTSFFILFFAIFLPTLIHVFIFTALFIIQGALKNKSATGIASVVVFVACALSFFIWKPVFGFYNVTNYARDAVSMDGRGFVSLNAAFITLFNMGKVTMETLFQDKVGLSVGRFIAFAYTYHYLNWFSKTSVIKWHQVPRNWLVTVILLWVLSVVLYVYNYKTGLMALYFLSMLHVFLEFPLNYRSVIGIGQELKHFTGFSKAQGSGQSMRGGPATKQSR